MIRVAVLGAGIGAAHLEAYRELFDSFQVTMVVDRDFEKARAAAPDGIRIEADVAAALGDPQVDLIDICLPPHLHVDVALQALRAGKHVICEKPIATSLADVARLRKAIKASKRTYFPIFQYRYGPALDQLRALKQAGLTGAPIAGSVETHWCRRSDYYQVPWRGTWAGEGGGAILGHAIHVHDLISHLMDPITRVAATLGTKANPIETDDTGAILFETESGAMVTSSITLGAAQDETHLRLVFEHLTATSATEPYAPASGAWRFTARDKEQQDEVDEVSKNAELHGKGFLGAFEAIASALTGDPSRAVSFKDGARSIELVTAIYLSARTSTWVDLPLSEATSLWEGWAP